MQKQIKRLVDLADCKHLNKTDRDALQWAIQNLSPEQTDTETGFGGWDFSSWPAIPSKKVFEELDKSRKAKKKAIMLQSYIDNAAPHLQELSGAGVTVDHALKIAAVGGWVGFKATWVLNEIARSETEYSTEINIQTIADVLPLLKQGRITSVSQIPGEIRKVIETQFKLEKYKPETMNLLTKIGMAV